MIREILRNRGFGSARDCKLWRRYQDFRCEPPLFNGTANSFSATANLGAQTELYQPELKSPLDKIFGWVAERKGPLK
jgi:hypothetical protein